jgi:hypothetical protein
MADKAFDRILSSTEFGYLLGYTSSGPAPNGRARRIEVQVKRRGAEVSHRQAYIARAGEVRYDPRQALATTRIVSALNYGGEVKDLRLTAKLTDGKVENTRTVTAEITIDASRLVFARIDDRYLAALNLMVKCADYYGKNIGETWQSTDVKIPSSRLDEIRKNGLVVTVRLAVTQPPNSVTIVVYDYGSDLLGSLNKNMR